jgi:hydroxypyruvate isomerase
MPRFAANLSLLFTEVPLLERFGRAAAAGFEAVEILFPYEHAIGDLQRALADSGLGLVLFNTPPGDWAAGERGFACDPDRCADFRAALDQAAAYASALKPRHVHCMAGLRPAGAGRAELDPTYVANLRLAAATLGRCGSGVTIEPINRRDMPGYHLASSAHAVAVLDAVGAPNLRLQYDVYHAQRSEGELAATLTRLLERIGHVQIADTPGRHEPGSGEINYPFLFALLDRLGYAGWVACEYRPQAGTEAGLGWLVAERRRVVGAPAAGA